MGQNVHQIIAWYMELHDPMYDFMRKDTCYSSATKKHVRVLLSELCEREGVMPLLPFILAQGN